MLQALAALREPCLRNERGLDGLSRQRTDMSGTRLHPPTAGSWSGTLCRTRESAMETYERPFAIVGQGTIFDGIAYWATLAGIS